MTFRIIKEGKFREASKYCPCCINLIRMKIKNGKILEVENAKILEENRLKCERCGAVFEWVEEVEAKP